LSITDSNSVFTLAAFSPAASAAAAKRARASAAEGSLAAAGAVAASVSAKSAASAPAAPASALRRCAAAAARAGSAALATSITMSEEASMAMDSPWVLSEANIRPQAYAELDGGLPSERSISSASSLRCFWSRYFASSPSWARSASLARAPWA
jgi:hypothetical protein